MRMNVGQILETHMWLGRSRLGINIARPCRLQTLPVIWTPVREAMQHAYATTSTKKASFGMDEESLLDAARNVRTRVPDRHAGFFRWCQGAA